MPTAFVLITSKMGFDSDVLNALKKIRGVEDAYAVYGVYDLVAKVKGRTMDKLKNIIHLEIRKLVKAKSTLTMIVIEES